MTVSQGNRPKALDGMKDEKGFGSTSQRRSETTLSGIKRFFNKISNSISINLKQRT